MAKYSKSETYGSYLSVNPTASNPFIPVYTYPDANGVSLSIPLPTNPTDRNQCIAILRNHFSNSSAVQTHQALQHFTRAHVTPPVGFKIIPTIVVEVALAAGAPHGSYTMQLIYKKEIIGWFAVDQCGIDLLTNGVFSLSLVSSRIAINISFIYRMLHNRPRYPASYQQPPACLPAFSEAWKHSRIAFGVARRFDTGLRSNLLRKFVSCPFPCQFA